MARLLGLCCFSRAGSLHTMLALRPRPPSLSGTLALSSLSSPPLCCLCCSCLYASCCLRLSSLSASPSLCFLSCFLFLLLIALRLTTLTASSSSSLSSPFHTAGWSSNRRIAILSAVLPYKGRYSLCGVEYTEWLLELERLSEEGRVEAEVRVKKGTGDEVNTTF